MHGHLCWNMGIHVTVYMCTHQNVYLSGPVTVCTYVHVCVNHGHVHIGTCAGIRCGRSELMNVHVYEQAHASK